MLPAPRTPFASSALQIARAQCRREARVASAALLRYGWPPLTTATRSSGGGVQRRARARDSGSASSSPSAHRWKTGSYYVDINDRRGLYCPTLYPAWTASPQRCRSLVPPLPPWRFRASFYSTVSPTPTLYADNVKGGSHGDVNGNNNNNIDSDDFLSLKPPPPESFNIPQRKKHKVVSASDAVSLVSNGDTICVSGFVSQGAPEAVLKALGERYESSGSPHSLTLLFGGGPGDWDAKGLNHLAKGGSRDVGSVFEHPMLRRTIGGHYGQVPRIASLAVNNDVEAWTLPMGSISRMIRSQSAHSPGYISTVGLGTFIDPDISGGAQNDAARNSPLHRELVSKINIQDRDYLLYKSLPVHVAIIRATTADSQGNLSVEHESLLADQKIMAAAARNSGGIVIAQVKRICEAGSLPARSVAVPGPLVDCVVLAEDEADHPMSYETEYDPALTLEIRAPRDALAKMPLDTRKIVARRASFGLKPGKIVNLGIGLPEGVASVAAEEGFLDYITLTTESGVFGGLPASGRNFGPSVNAESQVEMNQMFDYYDGGGLDMCFLGAAQISEKGDVNVSRMSQNRITGPGGFLDISQNTLNICFMSSFTAKGLEVSVQGGKLKIQNEGQIKKFLPEVMEKTFSGDEAVRRGQKVYYVTERAVFKRSADHDVLELVEIAPGVDLQKDVLDKMDFTPVVSTDLKIMDPRIFRDEKMDMGRDIFGSLQDRCSYHPEDHSLFVDLAAITISTEDDIRWFIDSLEHILKPLVQQSGPVDMIINYEGFDIRAGIESAYFEEVGRLEKNYYRSVKRYCQGAFTKAKLGQSLQIMKWDPAKAFELFDKNHDGIISTQEFREGMKKHFGIKITPKDLRTVEKHKIDLKSFTEAVKHCLESSGKVSDNQELIVDEAA